MSSSEGDYTCRLCNGSTALFWTDLAYNTTYHKCLNCCSISQSGEHFLSKAQEKHRYLNHENDVNDIGYQHFVSPITEAVLTSYNPKLHAGLDFGCGTGPVISHLLAKKGFQMTLYDPFFFPDETFLEKHYDFIACCEVMEHFHSPKTEFSTLRKLLKPRGKLYCKTALISNEVTAQEFSNWYYKNDPTHVFFYSPLGLEYIKASNQFSDLVVSKKLITFIV